MIYVMSDIHGNLRRFRSVLKQIKLKPADTLYILGDVVDRHPDGIKILRWIMAQKNVKMLLGNHEYMMLRALGHPYDEGDDLYEDDMRLWYRNGGKITHDAMKHQRIAAREEIYRFLRGLPLNFDLEVNGTHYKLVHGAPSEEYENFIPFYENRTHFSVWKRWRYFEKQHGAYTVIFGHTPTLDYQFDSPMKIWYGNHRIGIDCGSGFSEVPGDSYSEFGRLACLRLDDMTEFYSEEPWKEESNGQ